MGYLDGLDLDTLRTFRPLSQPVEEEQGDVMRGAKMALGQTVPILKGMAGLAGATAEEAFGEGGLSTALKDWGLKGYQEGMAKLAPLQKDTDELTTSWARAQEGDIGALADFAQYGLGYAIGQLGEAAAMAIVGGAAGAAAAPAAAPVAGAAGALTGIVGKGAVKTMATSLIEKAVVKQAQTMMKAAPDLAMEEAVKQATKVVAKNIGATGALLGYGTTQSLGSIYPEAEAQAAEKGLDMTGADLARVWGAGLAAGGVEGLTDKLGLSALMGRVKIPGTGRAGSALTGAAGGMAIEGATEGVQTAIERYGAQQDLGSDEAIDSYINAAGLGAIGGGAIGGAGGLMHTQKRAQQDEGMLELADAQDGNAAVDAFQKIADAQIDIQAEATSLMARAAQMRAAKQQAAAQAIQDDFDSLLGRSTGVIPTGDEPLALPAPEGAPTQFIADAQGGIRPSWEDPKPWTPEQADAWSSDIGRANIERWSTDRAPMGLEDSVRILRASEERGLDFTVVPHPAGSGYTVVPSTWITPTMKAQSDASLAEMVARIEAPITPRAGQPVEPAQAQPMTDDAMVRQMVEQRRNDGTLAGRAFAREFDAGRITPADVMQTMPSPEQRSPDARLAAAAAQAPQQTDPIADRLTQLVRSAMTGKKPGGITVETSRARTDPALQVAAQVADGPRDGRGDLAGGSVPAVGSDRPGGGSAVRGDAGPDAGGQPAVPVADVQGSPARRGGDAALTPAVGDKIQVVGGKYNGTVRTLVGKTPDGWYLVSNTGGSPIEVKNVSPVGAENGDANADKSRSLQQRSQDANLRDVGQHEGALQQSEARKLPEVRGGRDSGLSPMGGELSGVSGGRGGAADQSASTRQDRRGAGVSAGERSLGDGQAEPAEQIKQRGPDSGREDANASGMVGATRDQPVNLGGAAATRLDAGDGRQDAGQSIHEKNLKGSESDVLSTANPGEEASQTSSPQAAPAQDATEPVARPAGEPASRADLIEHTTTKGKKLRGVVLPITKDQAREIDQFTFRRGDDGWFIREKHLGDPRVQALLPKAEPAVDVAGEKLDGEWTAFAADTGTKGIPRADMPQIRAEHRGAMTNFLNARGIAHEITEVPATSLKPTQAEFSPAKVQQARDFVGGDRSILVSSDGYVLDGHHQWLAKRDAGEPVKVIRLDAPIDKLMTEVREFPSAETDGGALNPGQTPAKPRPNPGQTPANAEVNPGQSAEQPRPIGGATPANAANAQADALLGGMASTKTQWDGGDKDVRRRMLTDIGRADIAESSSGADWNALSLNLRMRMMAKVGEKPPAAEKKPVTPQVPTGAPAAARVIGQNEQADRTDLDGRKITIDVEVGDTGKTAKMTMDAGDAVRDVKARLAAAQELLRCLNA